MTSRQRTRSVVAPTPDEIRGGLSDRIQAQRMMFARIAPSSPAFLAFRWWKRVAARKRAERIKAYTIGVDCPSGARSESSIRKPNPIVRVRGGPGCGRTIERYYAGAGRR